MAAGPRVEVICDPDADGVPPVLEAVSLRAAERALDMEHRAGPDRVTVLLTGDETLRSLNLQFNGEDEVTDVLSFNETEGWHDGAPPEGETDVFPVTDDQAPRLGDIAISVPQAARQAEHAGHSLEREVALLTVHGVLHLLGFDHAEAEEEQAMFARTDAILESLFPAG